MILHKHWADRREREENGRGENGIYIARDTQYVQMFPIERISRNNDNPRAATSTTAGGRLMERRAFPPWPVFRAHRGLGPLSLHRFPADLAKLDRISTQFPPFDANGRDQHLWFFLFPFPPPPLTPLPTPRDPKSPLGAEIGTRCLRACREYANILLGFFFLSLSLFLSFFGTFRAFNESVMGFRCFSGSIVLLSSDEDRMLEIWMFDFASVNYCVTIDFYDDL